MKEDAVHTKKTQEILDSASERVKQSEEDKENREMIDAAREQMKAVIDGGLQLDEEKITLEDAFDKIQEEMKDKFTNRLNTNEMNEQIAVLMQGQRIYETFEIAPEEFTVKFQSINSDENAFIGQVALLNGPALRNGTEDIARYDGSMRTELMMAFSTISINQNNFKPISVKDLYEEEDEGAKIATVGDKIKELIKRLGEIRQKLPLGTYPTAITAMGAWTEYQQDLVSPKRIGNFSTPPSEHS